MPALVTAAPEARVVPARRGQGDDLALFALAAAGMLALAPRIVLMLQGTFMRLAGESGALPDLAVWPYVPRMLPLGVVIALVTFRFERRVRMAGLVLSLLPIAWLRGSLDIRSLVPLALFALATYGLIRLRLPRVWVGVLVTAFACLALAAMVRLLGNTPAVRVLATFPVLVPLLWYSVYEHGRQTVLGLRRFLLYLSTRLFSSPVLTYADLFTPVAPAELKATRWSGVRTIYIALLASIGAHVATRLGAVVPRGELEGLPLLAMSYVEYVGFYCNIVMRFNTVIGVLRLFGIPLRSNFNYWLVARTPNEHWQRWNILAREWYLTFIFYPLMRVRRSLLLAVMVVMLASGVLHVLPLAVLDGFRAPQMFASLVYAVANALAIYAVIALPRAYPSLVPRLRMRNSLAWSVVGVVVTSAFYSVLHGLRVWSGSWSEMAGYLSRLAGSWPV